MVAISARLRGVAVALMKIANDTRPITINNVLHSARIRHLRQGRRRRHKPPRRRARTRSVRRDFDRIVVPKKMVGNPRRDLRLEQPGSAT
jgi:hypothetical protein